MARKARQCIKGKRGRLAKSDAKSLHEAFVRRETETLLFARSSAVPLMNNRSDHDIWMVEVKPKISGCFQSRKCAEACCRISSCLKWTGYKGRNPMTTLQIALMGKAEKWCENDGSMLSKRARAVARGLKLAS